MKKLAIVVIGLICNTVVLADTPVDRITEGFRSSISESDQAKMDEAAASKLPQEEVAQASQWKLEPRDWVKYKRIMEGPRGIWSPGLDPLTALGVEATDDRERLRIARIWTQVESERTAKELRFEVARQLVKQEILGDQKLVENEEWIREWENKQKRVRKQVLLFVDQSCREECEELVTEVKESVKHNARLDIFFAPGATNKQLQDWAAYMRIDKDEVVKRQITLNYDQGKSSSSLLSPPIDMKLLPQVRVLDLVSKQMIATFRD